MKLRILVFLLILFAVLPSCSATIYIPLNAHLGFGNGSYLSFSSAITSSRAYRSSSYWILESFNGTSDQLIMNLDDSSATFQVMNTDWLNYTVDEWGGTQKLQISEPHSVWLDNWEKEEGDGWSYSAGVLTVENGAYSAVAVELINQGGDYFDSGDLAEWVIASFILIPLGIILLIFLIRRRR